MHLLYYWPKRKRKKINKSIKLLRAQDKQHLWETHSVVLGKAFANICALQFLVHFIHVFPQTV